MRFIQLLLNINGLVIKAERSMYKFFITDFIKNKLILLLILTALGFELLLFESINNCLLLFGLPYCISIILNYLMNYSPSKKPIAKISAQFKAQSVEKVKIIRNR